MKRVPTAEFAPVLRRLLAAEDAESYRIVEERAGIGTETLDCILRERHEGCDFDAADKLLCALGATHLWWGELAHIYYAIDLGAEKCRRDGCSVTFDPVQDHMGGRRRTRQRFCSRKCQHMDWHLRKGHIADATKKNLKDFCRNGHKRTEENTSIRDGKKYCLACDRASQKKRRTSLSPEEIERRREYQREYYKLRKMSNARMEAAA